MSNPNENKPQEGGRPAGKNPKWFSKKYRTREESDAAKQRHLEAQRAAAKGRKFDYSTKTPRQRLNILDRRLGKGVGARKERARLQAAIAAERAARKAIAQ